MKYGRRSLLLAIILCVWISPLSSVTASQTTKNMTVQWYLADYYIDSVKVALKSNEPVIVHNKQTYVPLRLFALANKQTATYDRKKAQVRLTTPKKAIKLTKSTAKLKKTKKTMKIKVTLPKLTYFQNGKPLKFSGTARPFLYKNQLYFPSQYAVQRFTKKVSWDAKKYTFRIANDQYKSLIASIEKDLNVLKVKCQNDLLSVYDQYKAANTKELKQKYYNQAMQYDKACAMNFNQLMTKLSDRLVVLRYNPDPIVKKYQAQYETIKEQAIATLASKQ